MKAVTLKVAYPPVAWRGGFAAIVVKTWGAEQMWIILVAKMDGKGMRRCVWECHHQLNDVKERAIGVIKELKKNGR